MRRRLLLTAATLILLMAVGAWCGWWFFLSTYGQRMAASANAADAEPRLTYSAMERFGFPFTVGLRFKNAAMTGKWGAGEITLSAPSAEISAKFWAPREMTLLTPTGVQWKTTASSPVNIMSGQSVHGEGRAGRVHNKAGIWTVEMDLAGITHKLADKAIAPLRAETGRITWTRLEAPTSAKAKSAIQAAFFDMTFPEGSLFGPKAKRASAEFTIDGAFPFSGKPEAIKAWRMADGRVDIQSAQIKWGGLDVTAAGALGLDSDYRLAGGVDLRLDKGERVIDRLAALGQLNATAAAAAKTVLALAALSAKDGRAAAPLTFADGEAAVAGFTLGRLQPVCSCE